jgi:tagatose 6-phosphate kinase
MILCLGTTPAVQRTMTFRRLLVDDVNRAIGIAQYASGKSINAARVLRALGKEVLATGFAGGDSGKFLRTDLDRAGIAHDFLEVTPPTRLCITVVDEEAGTATELIEEAAGVEQRAYAKLLREMDANLWRAKAVILSGSLPPGAPADLYARCVERCNQEHVPVVLDARGQALAHALACKPLIVKPNREELAATLGMPVDSEDALRTAMQKLVELGAQWIAVTLGKEGAMVSNGQDFWRILAPAVKAVSAIGSGDSFAAGLAAGIAQQEEIPQACALASACGAANALTAFAGHINVSDVKTLLSQIRVERLKQR